MRKQKAENSYAADVGLNSQISLRWITMRVIALYQCTNCLGRLAQFQTFGKSGQ